MTNNPYNEPTNEPERLTPELDKNVGSTAAVYNAVTDTVGGLNVRKSDNLFQAKFIAVSILLMAIIGAIVVKISGDQQFPWYAGALLGAFAGLVLGFFASGMILMVYRAARHLQGKHD